VKIEKTANAGSLESSDAMVTVGPHPGGIEIAVTSPVERQFGDRMRRTARDILAGKGIMEGLIRIDDRGALDCTLRARLETAIERGTTPRG
jgi:citrate lyase subunit gamma (acyl carrier protein)